MLHVGESIEEIRAAHVFEAKDDTDFESDALSLYVVQEMAFWCWKTGYVDDTLRSSGSCAC